MRRQRALKVPDGSPINAHFTPLTQFTPGRFLSVPGLWFGLVSLQSA
jgi:hypothetical protein